MNKRERMNEQIKEHKAKKVTTDSQLEKWAQKEGNGLTSAFRVLRYVAKNNIPGKLIKTRRNGREIREYDILGTIVSVEAWYTEHTY